MIIKAECDGARADSFIASFSELTRSGAVKLIEEGRVLINGATATKKQPVFCGDIIDITVPEAVPAGIQPEKLDFDVIYQDADIAVINKPQGMVVHPAHGNYSGTLVQGLLYEIKDLSGINGEIRPGIVHRLDKNTSGVIIIAKNDRAHVALAKQFKERSCEKIYLALAEGIFKQTDFTVETNIGRSRGDRKKMAVTSDGRFASTEFTVLEQFTDEALVSCKLNTGRTHQIRVHLAYIGHPCLGDAEYGFKKNRYALAGQALHSYSLEIDHPITGERMKFVAPLPEYMEKLIEKLRKKGSSGRRGL